MYDFVNVLRVIHDSPKEIRILYAIVLGDLFRRTEAIYVASIGLHSTPSPLIGCVARSFFLACAICRLQGN